MSFLSYFLTAADWLFYPTRQYYILKIFSTRCKKSLSINIIYTMLKLCPECFWTTSTYRHIVFCQHLFSKTSQQYYHGVYFQHILWYSLWQRLIVFICRNIIGTIHFITFICDSRQLMHIELVQDSGAYINAFLIRIKVLN